MKVQTQENITIITSDQDDLNVFLSHLIQDYKTFQAHHLILNLLSHGKIPVKDANSFLPLSKEHKKAKKSFVIVTDTDFNKASVKLSLVPTLQEAYDIIELEEIERDLGF